MSQLIGFMAREASIAYPFNLVMSFKELRYFQRILAMALYAEMKRFKPLKQKPCVKR
ncbi:hypothetical protein D3C81_2092880 [compost metagenome]